MGMKPTRVRKMVKNSTSPSGASQNLFSGACMIISIILTCILAITAWKSNESTTKQVDLVNIVARLIESEKEYITREHFLTALDEAEGYCPKCNSDYIEPLIVIPLDKALKLEPQIHENITAIEYCRLAYLGSHFWDFQQTETFAKKALDKSQTPEDFFFSQVLLGHIYFTQKKDDPKSAQVEIGREYFQKALSSIKKLNRESDQYLYGCGFAEWSIHEAYLNNKEDCIQNADHAKSAWDKLANRDDLIKELQKNIKKAKEGTKPEISCFLKPSSSISCSPLKTPTMAPVPLD